MIFPDHWNVVRGAPLVAHPTSNNSKVGLPRSEMTKRQFSLGANCWPELDWLARAPLRSQQFSDRRIDTRWRPRGNAGDRPVIGCNADQNCRSQCRRARICDRGVDRVFLSGLAPQAAAPLARGVHDPLAPRTTCARVPPCLLKRATEPLDGRPQTRNQFCLPVFLRLCRRAR